MHTNVPIDIAKATAAATNTLVATFRAAAGTAPFKPPPVLLPSGSEVGSTPVLSFSTSVSVGLRAVPVGFPTVGIVTVPNSVD